MSIKQSGDVIRIRQNNDEIIKVIQNGIILFSSATLIKNIVGYTITGDEDITYGQSYNIVLTPLTGYQALPWNTRVTMDGVDITSTAYNSSKGAISIANVTGDVSIEAEAVELPSTYKPVEWIENATYVAGKGSLTTPYKPSDVTKVEMDCAVRTANNYGEVFGTIQFATNPRYAFSAKWALTGNTAFNFGSTADGNKAANNIIYNAIKQTIVANGNKVTYTKTGGSRYTLTVDSTLATPWRSTRNLQLCSSIENNSTTYYARTRLWQCKISEGGTLLYHYIPVKKISDNSVGVWDKVNGTFIQGDYTFIAPYRGIGGTRTNCAITRLSDATTGTATAPVIGSTWSIKITQSSGYTFTGGTTPTVEIDGVDVTSTTVTDNGDGTYTVTIVDVPDKSIEITAACVADPNAVQSNSLLSGSLVSPSDTPDEPNDLDPIDMEDM